MSTAPRTSRFISNAAIMPSALCSSTPTTASGSLSLLLGYHPATQEARSPSGLGGGPEVERRLCNIMRAVNLTTPLPQYVSLWHQADMLNALTNVRFWGKADSNQPLLTNLDL